MKRLAIAVLSVLALLSGLLVGISAPASAAPTPSDNPDDWVNVYTGEISSKQLDAVIATGVDRHEVQVSPGSTEGTVQVELILPGVQADELIAQGLDLVRQEQTGASSSRLRAQALNNDGYNVFRKYGSEGGLKQEYEELAAAYPDITKVVTIGQTTQGQDIIAVKVTRNAQRTRDGSRPATIYNAAQHAREWITPEMNRRLFRYYLEGYGNDPAITQIVNRSEVWFVPVANPDGYDFTFEEGQRLWRKNLRDNNGDGQITSGDGVDLNRNWSYRWGYDNEGSSPSTASETYRGPAPGSEPETQAQDALFQRVTPEFLINYHSAAELLLYGTGWQVATPTPDDVVYEAMAGDDVIGSAIPGYDPDISAELYTTNGETTDHAHNVYDILAFTPEMATCESASDVDPNDEYLAEDCQSGFNFPDSEALIQAEFEKNIPFAIATAQSAADPDDPVSVLGIDTPSLVADTFDVSYGDPQTVAVWAKREARQLRLHYSVNGGREQRERISEWEGGDRYGDGSNTYYGEFRGEVTGTAPGDSVEVWFEAVVPREGRVDSEHFTYTVASDSGAPALVLANEDYTGVNPTYDPQITAPKYAAAHQQALTDAGYASDVWDVDAQGVPHPLGVLSHYEGVLWYLGDNRLTQDPEDEVLEYGSQRFPDSSVAERQQYLTINVRDYLNEGGGLLHSGETTSYFGFVGPAIGLGGIYYGLDDNPTAECRVTADPFSDCLILSDDFAQYWLGTFNRSEIADVPGVIGTDTPFEGAAATFGGPALVDNPLDEAGVFIPLSNILDPAQFPQFGTSLSSMVYDIEVDSAYQPVEGEWYVGTIHQDNAYQRLTRTIVVPDGAASAQLQFQLSYNMEESYDNVIVEVHTVGQDDWTTLPDIGPNALTTQDTPAECAAGPGPDDDSFLINLHPSLENYLSGDPCAPSGETGDWHAFTGDSGGWQQVAFDLTAYEGSTVEVSISNVTDPAFGGVGVFIDDTRVVIDGVTEAEGFETGLGAWSIPGPPPGSPPNPGDFERAQQLVEAAAAVTTEISIQLGFGLEQIESAEERAAVVGRAFDYLLN